MSSLKKSESEYRNTITDKYLSIQPLPCLVKASMNIQY